MAKKKETGFDKLARLIKSESDDIRSTMATKKETATKADMNTGFTGIMTELTDIKQRLRVVEEAVGEHSRYTKEIDYAFERMAAIEKHLALKQKARA